MLKIETRNGARNFMPGGDVEGSVRWLLDLPPESVELRLFWYTRGKGSQDVEVVEVVRFDRLAQEDTRAFRLRLPPAPYSFSGKLISLTWALEVVAKPFDETERLDITMSPTGEEVVLHR